MLQINATNDPAKNFYGTDINDQTIFLT